MIHRLIIASLLLTVFAGVPGASAVAEESPVCSSTSPTVQEVCDGELPEAPDRCELVDCPINPCNPPVDCYDRLEQVQALVDDLADIALNPCGTINCPDVEAIIENLCPGGAPDVCGRCPGGTGTLCGFDDEVEDILRAVCPYGVNAQCVNSIRDEVVAYVIDLVPEPCSVRDIPGLCSPPPGPCDVYNVPGYCSPPPGPCDVYNAPAVCHSVCYDVDVPVYCGPVNVCDPIVPGVDHCNPPPPCDVYSAPVLCGGGIHVDPCDPLLADRDHCLLVDELVTYVLSLVPTPGEVLELVPDEDDVHDAVAPYIPPDTDGDDVPDLLEQAVCGSALVRNNLNVSGYVHCVDAADLYVEPTGTFTDTVNETRDAVTDEVNRTVEEVERKAGETLDFVNATVAQVLSDVDDALTWVLGEVEKVRDQVDADRDGVPDEAEPWLCQVENVNFPQDGSCDETMTDYRPPGA